MKKYVQQKALGSEWDEQQGSELRGPWENKNCGQLGPLGLGARAVGSCLSGLSLSSEAALTVSRATRGRNGKVRKALITHTFQRLRNGRAGIASVRWKRKLSLEGLSNSVPRARP